MEWVISKLTDEATDLCRVAEGMQTKLKEEASDIRRAAEEMQSQFVGRSAS